MGKTAKFIYVRGLLPLMALVFFLVVSCSRPDIAEKLNGQSLKWPPPDPAVDILIQIEASGPGIPAGVETDPGFHRLRRYDKPSPCIHWTKSGWSPGCFLCFPTTKRFTINGEMLVRGIFHGRGRSSRAMSKRPQTTLALTLTDIPVEHESKSQPGNGPSIQPSSAKSMRLCRLSTAFAVAPVQRPNSQS